jgi:hypothetical protein
LEYALYADSDSIPEESRKIFKKKSATRKERALSGAWNYVDEALVDLDVDGNPVEGASHFADAYHFWGYYLGLGDPHVLPLTMQKLAKKRHLATNKYYQKIQSEYLEKIEIFGSKSEAADYFDDEYGEHVTRSTIWTWLSKLPLPPNPKRKQYVK